MVEHTSSGVLHALFNRTDITRAHTMKRLMALVALAPVVAFASPSDDKQTALLAHGKYIVERVGMCADCHTPHGPDGKPIKGQELHGWELPMTPNHPVPGWADHSVNIAGMPTGYTEDQLAVFLQTGRTPAGKTASPPMPPYRLNARDARAVAVYLHSLN